MKYFSALFALLLCTVLPAQTQRSLGASEADFWRDFSKLYAEFLPKKEADEDLLSLKSVYDDPSWEHRAAFQDLTREMLRKRIVDAQTWSECLKLAIGWYSNASEQAQARWWAETSELVQKSSRAALSEYLHTAAGMSVGFSSPNARLRLFEAGPLRWELEFGDATLDEESPSTRYRIEGAVLRGYFKNDSTQIDSLSGWYDPRSALLTAESGRVDWYRAGYGYGEVYNELGRFSLDLRQTGFVVDSALLQSMYYINQPLRGRFEERLGTRSTAENAMYPRFEAYANDLVIPNFFEDVTYRGGFSLVGANFFASGSPETPAAFEFMRDSSLAATLRAERFVVRPTGLSAKVSAFSLRLGAEDSLHHAKVEVKYAPDSRELQVFRPDEGLANKPFSDSYHNVTIDLDQLRWTTSEPRLFLSGLNMGSGAPMTIESDQYYRNNRYVALQGFESENPLVLLDQVGQGANGARMTIKDVAIGMGMPVDPCERLMMEYHLQGFVRYRTEDRSLEVLPKTGEYVMNHRKKRDYDVIQFESVVPEGMNAELNLLNFDLELAGVDRIWLSDSQKVSLHPVGGRLLLHEGLDFDFDGLIRAGRFEFFGREHQFDYQDFSFRMPTVDSMRFFVPAFELNEQGERPLVRVRNTLEDISGDLYIDRPDNKSSTLFSPEYPIFKSGKGAKIYYDKVEKGVYARSRFYVDLDAFTIDSLDNALTESLGFESTFLSAGIFATRRQVIKVQRDYSLGFIEETGPEGWAAYPSMGSDAGLVRGSVQLSLSGFRFKGDLTYQRAGASSDEFRLYPDSTKGRGTFDLKELVGAARGAGHPSAQGTDVRSNWHPYAKTWYATTLGAPMATYSARPATASGRLTYQPDRLSLKGTAAFDLAELSGSDLKLHHKWIQSGMADFRVKGEPEAQWGFSLTNASADVDFVAEQGKFSLLDGDRSVDFPRNQYQAEMDRASWDILEKSISLQKGSGVDSRMTSTHPGQDGLNFLAGRAKFWLIPSRLEAYGVPHIDIADSRVVPDSGRATIKELADMQPLHNARILASRVGAYHKIDSAELKIQGRLDLYGSGIYRYLDQNNKSWRIPMGRIDVDSSDQMVAQGELGIQDDFFLSPYFRYYGIVRMEAQNPQLEMDGRIRITAECPALETDWIITRTRIDPMDILVTLPDPDTARPAQTVYNGIYLMQDSITPYTAFVRRNNPNVAVELFSTNGVLYYDESSKSYIVSSLRRVADPEAPDNWLELNTQSCAVTGYGQMSLGAKMGRVEMSAYGRIEHRLRSGRMGAKVALTLDFLMPEELSKPLKAALLSASGGPTDPANEVLGEALRRKLDAKDLKRYYESGLNDRMPKEFRQTLVLDEVDLDWKPNIRAFRSKDGVGVGSIAGDPVHRFADGTLELRKRRGGDEFTLHLAPSNEFFLTYKKGNMRFYSSDPSLMEALTKVDPKKRSLPSKDGLPFYQLMPTTGGAMKRFLDGLEPEEGGRD